MRLHLESKRAANYKNQNPLNERVIRKLSLLPSSLHFHAAWQWLGFENET